MTKRARMIMGCLAVVFATACGDGAYGPGGINNAQQDAAATPPADMQAPSADVGDNMSRGVCDANTQPPNQCACLGQGFVGLQYCVNGHWSSQCQCPTPPPPTDAGTTPPPDNGPACSSGMTCFCGSVVGATICDRGVMSCICTQPADAGTPDAGTPTDLGPLCGSGQTNCAGTCTDLQTDSTHCGNCATNCGPGNRCHAGSCEIDCAAGLTACDGQCVNTATTIAHCGRCSNACVAPAHALATCSGGGCGYACMPGFADANRSASDGCEVNLQTDVNNCGTVGTVCNTTAPHSTASCSSGRCIALCATNFADANHDPADGCEADLMNDRANCGTVGTVCPSGQLCCAGNCADTRESSTNCGRCGNACGVSSACVNSQCTGTCSVGWLTCGGNCYDPQISTMNCGRCGITCLAPAHASASCQSSTCVTGTCNTGYGDCNGTMSDGCETSLNSDAMNCGRCGNRCPSGPNATATCGYGGTCGLRCAEGYWDCDGVASNGCEVNLNADNANCGWCGQRCGTNQTCNGGWCELTCASPTIACGGRCVDPRSDVNNCGGCGLRCTTALNMATSCVANTCTYTCSAGYTHCGSGPVACETNIMSDVANCGACGRTCASGQTCVSGACTGGTPTCTSPFILCGSSCLDPRGDPSNCGACGRVCASGQVCSASACITIASDAGTSDAGDSGLMPGEHTLYIQNGSGVASAGVTVGSISSMCRGTMVIAAWNNIRGGMRNSSPGAPLDTPMSPGRANTKFYCGASQIDLCAQYAMGRRNAADLLGSDAIVRVDGRSILLSQVPIVRDIYGGGCAMSVAITEPDGSIKPGAMLP